MRIINGETGYAEAGAQGFEGEAPRAMPSSAPKMRLDPLCNFSLLAHPFRWDVALTVDGPQLLPRLRFFYYEPGSSGVIQVKGLDDHGQPITDGNAALALGALREQGWIEIPRNIEVEAWGVKRIGYATRYSGENGPVHLSAWHKPYALGNRVVLDFDETGWHRFLKGLVASGLVKEATGPTARAVRLRLERAMRRRANHATTNATARAASELYEQKVKAIPSRTEAALAAAKAEPKAKAAKPKASEPTPNEGES